MRTNILLGSAFACVALGLTGCGGGSSGSTSADASASPGTSAATSGDGAVPPSAVASIDSFLAYQQTLGTSDTIEPLTLQQRLPPIDDTKEPTPVL